MTISKFKFVIIVLFTLSLTATACNNKPKKAAKTEQTEKKGKEYTSAYVCPMHCEGSGSSDPGKCPVCGMDYVKNENHNNGSHNH